MTSSSADFASPFSDSVQKVSFDDTLSLGASFASPKEPSPKKPSGGGSIDSSTFGGTANFLSAPGLVSPMADLGRRSSSFSSSASFRRIPSKLTSFQIRQQKEDDRVAAQIIALGPAVMTGEGIESDGEESDTLDGPMESPSNYSYSAGRQGPKTRTKAVKLRKASMWEVIVLAIAFASGQVQQLRRQKAISKLSTLMFPLVLRRKLRKAKHRRRFTLAQLEARQRTIEPHLREKDEEELPDRPSPEELQMKIPLFAEFSRWTLTRIIEQGMELIAFDDREIIVKPGDLCFNLHYICRGTCAIVKSIVQAPSVRPQSGGSGGQPPPSAAPTMTTTHHFAHHHRHSDAGITTLSTMRTGDYFGDLLGVPVSYDHTTLAKGEVMVWRLTKEKFEEIVKSEESAPKILDVLETARFQRSLDTLSDAYPITLEMFKRTPIFKQWSEDVLTETIPKMRPALFSKGDVVFHQGSPSNGVYIILGGEVGLYRESLVEFNPSFSKRSARTINQIPPHEKRGYVQVLQKGKLFDVTTSDDVIASRRTEEYALIGHRPYVILERHRFTSIVHSPFLKAWYVPDSAFVDLFLSSPQAFLDLRREALVRRARQMVPLRPEQIVNVPLFQHLPLHRLERLCQQGLTPRVVERGEALVEAHQPVDGIYLVASGDLKTGSGAASRSLDEFFFPAKPLSKEVTSDAEGDGESSPLAGTLQRGAGSSAGIKRQESTLKTAGLERRQSSNLTGAREGEEEAVIGRDPSRPVLHLGGSFEGLLLGNWPDTWKATTVVEAWFLPLTAMRLEFTSLPDHLRKATLLAARAAQQIAMKMDAPLTAAPPPLPSSKNRDKNRQSMAGAGGVAAVVQQHRDRARGGFPARESSISSISSSRIGTAGRRGRESSFSPSVDRSSGIQRPKFVTTGSRSPPDSPRRGRNGEFPSSGEGSLTGKRLQRASGSMRRRPSAAAREMTSWLNSAEATGGPRGRATDRPAFLDRERTYIGIMDGEDIVLSEREIHKQKLRGMPMKELISAMKTEKKRPEYVHRNAHWDWKPDTSLPDAALQELEVKVSGPLGSIGSGGDFETLSGSVSARKKSAKKKQSTVFTQGLVLTAAAHLHTSHESSHSQFSPSLSSGGGRDEDETSKTNQAVVHPPQGATLLIAQLNAEAENRRIEKEAEEAEAALQARLAEKNRKPSFDELKLYLANEDVDMSRHIEHGPRTAARVHTTASSSGGGPHAPVKPRPHPPQQRVPRWPEPVEGGVALSLRPSTARVAEERRVRSQGSGQPGSRQLHSARRATYHPASIDSERRQIHQLVRTFVRKQHSPPRNEAGGRSPVLSDGPSRVVAGSSTPRSPPAAHHQPSTPASRGRQVPSASLPRSLNHRRQLRDHQAHEHRTLTQAVDKLMSGGIPPPF